MATKAKITGIKAEVTEPKTKAKIIIATEIPIVSPVTKSFSASSRNVCSIDSCPIK